MFPSKIEDSSNCILEGGGAVLHRVCHPGLSHCPSILITWKAPVCQSIRVVTKRHVDGSYRCHDKVHVGSILSFKNVAENAVQPITIAPSISRLESALTTRPKPAGNVIKKRFDLFPHSLTCWNNHRDKYSQNPRRAKHHPHHKCRSSYGTKRCYHNEKTDCIKMNLHTSLVAANPAKRPSMGTPTPTSQ